MDLPAGNLEDFKARSLNNYHNRCLHHHVFDIDLIKKLCVYCDLKIIKTCEDKVDNYVLAQKSKI